MLTGQILLQLIVILIVVQFFGVVCGRIGLQWVIGEILAGLALGPSLLGAFLPGVSTVLFATSVLPVLQTLGDIGLIFYMFSLGARLDTHMMVRQSKVALLTSLSGIFFPLILGATLAFFLFPGFAGPKATQISFLLMVGTAMSITAFPVLARFLTEKKLLGTRIGTLSLTCAAVGDIIAWCLLAFVIAIAQARDVRFVALTVGLTVLFIVCMLLIVRPLLAFAERRIRTTQTKIILVIVLLLLSAYCTDIIGIHPVFGAFLMGIILPRKPLFIELVRNIDQFNIMLFLPLYFVYSGLRTQIGLISTPWLWLICLLVLVIACAGKIFGSALPNRLMKESWRDAFSLGVLMNTRGLVELIVLNIGLDLGVLSPTMFTILVIMALLTTMMASPLLALLGYRRKSLSEPDNDSTRQELPGTSARLVNISGENDLA